MIRWSAGSFCVIFTKAEDFYDETKMDPLDERYTRFEFSFVTCHEDAELSSPCQMLTSTFNITCHSISIIFLIVLIDNTLQNGDKESRGTMPCIISGYMLQYFFLGFLFWINGMSFNIWFKFTRMSMQP